MTMFRYFPDNEGWSYHFAARIVNVARLGGADFHEGYRLRRRSRSVTGRAGIANGKPQVSVSKSGLQSRSAPAGPSPRGMPT